MIKNSDNNLLNAKETYIAHSVNCCGVMRDGFSLKIKNKYPDVYRRYCNYCSNHCSKNLIGRVLITPTDHGHVICNLFGQERSGYGSHSTNIAALSKAMNSLAKIVPTSEPIAMPYKIGCSNDGIGCNTIHRIIEDIFKDHTVVFYKT